MLTLSRLEEIYLDQLRVFKRKDRGIPRNIGFEKYLKTKQIVVVSGIRRSGKSTLLSQFSAHFPTFYYLNFDDERLIDFQITDFDNLMLAFRKHGPAKTIFIDEAQNVNGWERFVRRVYEEGYKIFVTGSNAKLLSSELATHLTGRYFKIELYPFSFKEFLNYKKIEPTKIDSEKKAQILKEFDNYLKYGGFPEFVKYQDQEFIKRIYEDVLYKDIVVRFKIREDKAFKQLANYLFTNFTKEISYNSLARILEFKSPMSVRSYISFMEEAYLVFELFKYDWSLKKQFVAAKKIFVVDNGMRNLISFSFSKDLGRLLENLVFLELKRSGKDVYYWKDSKECDFIIKEKEKITEAYQCTALLDKSNEKRELEGLIEVCKKFKLKTGWILTRDQEKKIKYNDVQIRLMPIWKWLLKIN